MIRVDALRKMPQPWFSFQATTSDGTEAGEDVWFSQLCADHGIKTYVHADVIVHHLVTMQVIPYHHPPNEVLGDNGEMQVRYLPQWGKTAAEAQAAREDRDEDGAQQEDLVETRLSGPVEEVPMGL